MTKNQIKLLLFLFAGISSVLNAQYGVIGGPMAFIPGPNSQKPLKLIEGDLKLISQLNKINIRFDYQYMSVCKFPTEEEYLNDIRKNKSPEKAEKEIENWRQMPKTILEPSFEELFNEHAAEIGLQTCHDTTQPTLIVKILREEPHHHQEAHVPPSHVNFECTFLDAEGYFVARYNLNVHGLNENKAAESQQGLKYCFSVAGKMLGKDLTKRIRKIREQG
jgi:hypothetical protein